MNGKTYELFRFTHPDGSAKEWGYAEMGTGSGLFEVRWGKEVQSLDGESSGRGGSGLFEVRWGKEGHLVQNQVGLSRATIHQREAEKLRKGYRSVGRRLIGSDGEVKPLARSQPSAPQRPPAPQPPPKKSKKPAIDITALLGGDEDGFYF